jgi:hypothetical protein
MKFNSSRIGLCASLVLLTSAGRSAGSLGVDFSSPGSQSNPSIWTLGYQFVANDAVSVTGLGVFDYLQDGLSGGQQVGLWDASQHLVASTTVTNADALQGFWRFGAIDPLALTPGDRYFVGSRGREGYTFSTNVSR